MQVARHIARSSEATGFVMGLLALVSAPFQLTMLRTPGWLLLALAFISSLAALATALAFADEVRNTVRRGVITAGIAAIVGACCFAWLSHRFPDTTFKAWLPGILSILPAMFCGMLTAGVAVLTLSNHSQIAQDPTVQSPQPRFIIWGIRSGMALLFLLATGIVDTSPSRAAAPEIPPQPQVSSTPPETFAVQNEMSQADAVSWHLSRSRTVPGVSSDLYTLSANDRWLATVIENRLALRVLDLHTFDSGKTIKLARTIDRLSFDPSAKRILAVSDSAPAELAVINLQNGINVHLPMPKKQAVPKGRLLWWREHEVLIGTSEKDLRVLNLETLELDEVSAVPSWKEINAAQRETIVKDMSLGLCETARWRWELSHSIQATELPEVEGTEGWPIGFRRCLAITHPERDFSLSFPPVDFQEGDLFSSSQDGAKVFRSRGSTLDIFYFNLSPAPHLKWALKMPHGIAKCQKAEEAKRALSVSRLCALVYAPLQNPLNGRVVGPRRDRVKAVLTFESWEEDKAECYVSDLYSPINPSDVIADPCVWNGVKSELLALETPHRWWAALPDPVPGSDAVSTLPTRESIGATITLLKKADDERVRSEGQAQPMERPVFAPQAPYSVVPAPRSVEDQIKDFVTAHHLAAQAGDVDRLVRNYDERVDHFNNGWVDRQFIQQDELKYHGENAVLEERILGPITVMPSVGTVHSVIYALRVSIQNRASGQAKTFTFDVSLGVVETPDGFRINRQKAAKQSN